jgi:hypothetical protein
MPGLAQETRYFLITPSAMAAAMDQYISPHDSVGGFPPPLRLGSTRNDGNLLVV